MRLLNWLPGGSAVKNPPTSTKDESSIPELGRLPEGGYGNPLQYSCLENPMDREARQATTHGGHRVRHNLATKEQQQSGSGELVCTTSEPNTSWSKGSLVPSSCLLSFEKCTFLFVYKVLLFTYQGEKIKFKLIPLAKIKCCSEKFISRSSQG